MTTVVMLVAMLWMQISVFRHAVAGKNRFTAMAFAFYIAATVSAILEILYLMSKVNP